MAKKSSVTEQQRFVGVVPYAMSGAQMLITVYEDGATIAYRADEYDTWSPEQDLREVDDDG